MCYTVSKCFCCSHSLSLAWTNTLAYSLSVDYKPAMFYYTESWKVHLFPTQKCKSSLKKLTTSKTLQLIYIAKAAMPPKKVYITNSRTTTTSTTTTAAAATAAWTAWTATSSFSGKVRRPSRRRRVRSVATSPGTCTIKLFTAVIYAFS